VNLYAGWSAATTPPSAATLIQSFTITFPPSTNFPVPEIVPDGLSGTGPNAPAVNTAQNWWAFSKVGCITPAVAATSKVPATPTTPEIPANYGTQGRLRMILDRVFAFGQKSSSILPATTSSYWPGVFLRPEYDTVRSMVPAHGDYRLVAASPSVSNFVKHRYYDDTTRHMAASLSGSNLSIRQETLPGNDVGGKYISSVAYNSNAVPDIPSNATQTPEATGDFDNGLASSSDGPYVNKPDEGDISPTATASTIWYNFPYFRLFTNDSAFLSVGATFFSPNRQIPSSGMLGSLSTGVKDNVPWKTLLFRPQTNHPSYSTTIPDHLFMDLFWMPVVEPYAISDRFSTAGKINMNYQILPFTYIERSTGLRAVLKAERLAAIPKTLASTYKGDVDTNANLSTSCRMPIDRDETLMQFQTKFTAGQIFKSASEICDIHIVPVGKTVADMAGTFWAANALTGDNLRERIYTTLYPRLTTKSNTFTVHFRVQALKQVPATVDGTWTDGKDVVLGEYRGATSIERFIDANNPDIPDYATDPTNAQTLDNFYRWRVVENRQFAP
jgi:uncharacterized protein (TIGR02600 family)